MSQLEVSQGVGNFGSVPFGGVTPPFSQGGRPRLLPSFQDGSYYVPYTQVAVVHQGERISRGGPSTAADTVPSTIHFQMPVHVAVTLPPHTSPIAAKDFVRQLAPYLQELVDQGQVRVRKLFPR